MKDYMKRRQLMKDWLKNTKEGDPLESRDDYIRHEAVEEYKKEQLALFSVSNSIELEKEQKRIWKELCKAVNETAFNSEIIAETDNVHDMIFCDTKLNV